MLQFCHPARILVPFATPNATALHDTVEEHSNDVWREVFSACEW